MIYGYLRWTVGGRRRRSRIVVYDPHIKEDDRSAFYVGILEMQCKVCIQGFSTKFKGESKMLLQFLPVELQVRAPELPDS